MPFAGVDSSAPHGGEAIKEAERMEERRNLMKCVIGKKDGTLRHESNLSRCFRGEVGIIDRKSRLVTVAP